MPDRRRHDWLLRLRRRVGRRGAFLLTFGLVFVLLGLGLFDRTLHPDEVATYAVITRLMPLTGWGAAAIVAGLTAWVGAVCRLRHIDAAGFAALQLVSTGWASGMALAVVLGANGVALRSAAVWATLTVAIGIVSGWPEPPR